MPLEIACPSPDDAVALMGQMISQASGIFKLFAHTQIHEVAHHQSITGLHPSAFVSHLQGHGSNTDGLSELSKRVMFEGGTEPPFRNAFWDEHRTGVYKDVLSGEKLFSSADKFDSGTGWPSFTQPIDPSAVQMSAPDALGRVEVHTAHDGHHLGHVFRGEGPAGHDRYCINSAALAFEPRGGDVASFLSIDTASAPTSFASQDSTGAGSKATLGLAGGCYWGLQRQLDSVPGVIETHVGFMGGPPSEHPTYESLEALNRNHRDHPWVETVQVTYSDKPQVLQALLKAFANFKDNVNHGLRYSREIFGDASQLSNAPDDAQARLVHSLSTRFEVSNRPFDQKYYAES